MPATLTKARPTADPNAYYPARILNHTGALIAALRAIEEGRWIEITPYPDDNYRVCVKDENEQWIAALAQAHPPPNDEEPSEDTTCEECGGAPGNIVGCPACCRDCGRPCTFDKDGEGFHADEEDEPEPGGCPTCGTQMGNHSRSCENREED